jgi:phenylacetate-CoA ligase
MAAVAIEDLLHPLLGRYFGAPRWARAAVGRAYACLPRTLRLGGAYGEFAATIERTRQGDSAARYSVERLGETLAWAIETVPAYRAHRRLLGEGRDPREILRMLPLTGKLDIKRDPARYLSEAMPRSAALATFTGGSTSMPMRFWLQKHVTRPKEYAFMHAFRRRVGAGEGEDVLALRGRLIAGAGNGRAPWAYEPIKRHLMLSCEHLSRAWMPQFAEALERYRPAVIEAFPSALFPLARWLEARPLPRFTRGVKGVMLFSENVYGFQLDTFRRVFGCPIVAHYGHSERVLMAATLPEDDRYFFWPQYGWAEIVDARGRRVTQPGRLGYVVGTSFDNRVMPFVRYRTGDLAMAGGDGHPHLPGFPVVERIAGRLQEFIACRDGRLISVTALGTAHFSELSEIEAMQYEQSAAGELALKVVSAAPLAPREERRIAEAIEARTQGGCRVAIARVDRIERTPRGKTRMLVQHLDLRSSLEESLGDRR